MIKEGVLLVCLLLVFGQRVFMYHNWKDFSKDTYTAFNLPRPLNYSLYHVRVYHHPAPLIYLMHLHGNGINVDASQWHYSRLYHGLHATIIAPEYDGYDNEAPSFTSQEKICARARLQYEYVRGLRAHASMVPLVVLGASLGTGVASCMLERHPQLPDALIMENAFTSVYDLLPRPLCWLLYDHWRVNISDTVRTLYVISEQDELIPPRHGHVLAKRSPNATRAVLPGCNHGDAPAHPLYLPKIRSFLRVALNITEYI